MGLCTAGKQVICVLTCIGWWRAIRMRHVMCQHDGTTVKWFCQLFSNVSCIRTMRIQHVFRRESVAVLHGDFMKVVEHLTRTPHSSRQIRLSREFRLEIDP